jgi:chorismate mutase/prephenate dehydratase
MNKEELNELRIKIDTLDHDIIDLLAKRIEIVQSVDEYKLKTGAPRYDAVRWQAASDKRAEIAQRIGAPAQLVSAVFEDIHTFVLDNVYAMPEACYLGPEGSFSHIAAQKVVDLGQYRLKPCGSWRDLYTQLRLSPDNSAVVPIENSISSNVHANVDALFEGDLYISGQTNIDINLGLFAKNGTDLVDIKHIYSHPQALMQATKKIKEQQWQQHEASSTSAALAYIKNSTEDDVACLAPVGSTAPGVHQLCENFQDLTVNQTRFIAISTKKPLNQTGNKTSVLFEIKHETGSLERLLQFLADQNYNLTKIESRPIPTKTWSYRFWIDLESLEQIKTDAITELFKSQQLIEDFIVLGIYTD